VLGALLTVEGVRDGRGDRTTAVARSDRGTTLGQRRGRLQTQETARSGWAHARRGEGGVGSATASSDTGWSETAGRNGF
jgi:hypothetical protein